ncbi:MAG: hypothetical protein AB7V45_16940 [Candidatus Krumholzibacteriia bacterium]
MSNQPSQSVVVSNVRMSFGAMVVFMVKWVLASIPAMLILGLIGGGIAAIFTGVFAGLLN